MATKGRMAMYQLTGAFFQLLGIITFVVAALKGLLRLVKSEKAAKSNNPDAAG
jgi:hypothetical protein